jgi:hypothetical protein
MAGEGIARDIDMKLRPHPILAVALAAAALAAPGAASAVMCYTVLDRGDNVVYRDTYPPIDLSDQGKGEREQMRRRGEQLIAMDTDRCLRLEFFLGNAGTTNLNVDQVVAGMPVRNTVGTAGGAPSGATSAGATPPSQRPARAMPPRKGS